MPHFQPLLLALHKIYFGCIIMHFFAKVAAGGGIKKLGVVEHNTRDFCRHHVGAHFVAVRTIEPVVAFNKAGDDVGVVERVLGKVFDEVQHCFFSSLLMV